MSTMDVNKMATNYGYMKRYLENGKDIFLINCSQIHPVGYYCSEQCRIRQHIHEIYHDNIAIYTSELEQVKERWNNYDKDIVDNQIAMYEKTFKEELIGLTTTKEVRVALVALEKKISAFFNPIHHLIEWMGKQKDLYDAVSLHLDKDFFDVFDQAKCLMQECLVRAVCVTNIDLVLANNHSFNLKLRLLIPSVTAVEATVCPFIVKTLDTWNLRIVGTERLHVYDHGPITSDFQNFYLIPAAESYNLQMPRIGDVANANGKKRGGKRIRKMTADSHNICPLERNARKFVLTDCNSAFEADFSAIRLERTSSDEQKLREQMKQTAKSNKTPLIRVTDTHKDVGMMKKISQRITGKKPSNQVAAAAVASVEPKRGKKEKENLDDSVSELLNYFVVALKIQFPCALFTFYKKIKVPVAVVSNHSVQSPEGYGSAIWNLIVWREEANKGNYQWDWRDQQVGMGEQKVVSDDDYPIEHQRFVDTYLNGLITVLGRVKLEPKIQVPTEAAGSVHNRTSVDNFEWDKDFSALVETTLSNKDLANIPNSLLSIGTDSIMELHNHLSHAGSNPVRKVPKNLNACQLDFLSAKLHNLSSSDGFVTRSSFLKTIVKDTKTSFFLWYFFTCQAIGKNFGIKAKISNWFGDPAGSVWHSNFVVGYIDESKADEMLDKFQGENQLLLLRFSSSEMQSIVSHVRSGPSGPVQSRPVEVGVSESLSTILRNPIFTPNYKVITCDDQGQCGVLKPISELHRWIDEAVNSGPNSPANLVPSASIGCVSYPGKSQSRYPRCVDAYKQIMAESSLRKLFADLQIKPNAAQNLCDLLKTVKQSNKEFDLLVGPETQNNLREILTANPELLTLLQCGADNSVAHDRPFCTPEIAPPALEVDDFTFINCENDLWSRL